MKRGWLIFLFIIVCMAASLGCGISVDLGQKTPSPTAAPPATLPPTASPTPPPEPTGTSAPTITPSPTPLPPSPTPPPPAVQLPELSPAPYNDPRGLISITLPVGWNIEQGEENTVTAMALDSSAMIVVTTTNTLVPLEKDFFTQFINDYEAYYALKFQGYAEIGRNVDAAAGKGNVTKNVRLGNKEYVFKTDYSRDGAILQSVNFLTLKPYAEAYIPLYQKIFASLKTNRENALKQMPYMETDKADDPAGKFSFSYPLGWYYAPMDSGNATGSTYVAPDGSMVLMIMAIPVTPGVAVTDELAKLFVSGFLKGYAADFVATGETKTAAGDLRVTFEAPSKNNKGVVIASNLGERVGLLLITYPADRANETSQLVEKLAGSYTKK